jgi:CO dehydrogenase nickel-insertion accessory protein CooC1
MKKFLIKNNFRGCKVCFGKSIRQRHDCIKYKIDDVITLDTDNAGLPKERFWRSRLKDKDIVVITEKASAKKKKEIVKNDLTGADN